jgi:flagellar hook-associated protein 2
MSSSTSAIFTGNSQFASSFQQVISNAVSMASLPMQQMQSEVSTLTSQSGELSTLNSDFASLQSSISTLNSALGLSSYSASSSANTVATASLSGTPSAGTYTVEVDSTGSYASAMSSDGLPAVTDPTQSGISDATAYTLDVGADSYTINTSGDTLTDLANAINTSSAGVQATVVNVGAQGTTDYRLSIQDNNMEDVTIQLTAANGSAENTKLLSPQTEGAATTYRVNGKPGAGSDPLSTSTPNITVAPGVTVTLAGVGTASITVGQNTNAVSSALSGFVTAYNKVQAEINTNRGQGTGALQGQSILSNVSTVLQQILDYSAGSGGISSLDALGVSFPDNTGVLSFDSSTFSSATQGQMTALSNFLGSTATGGFLQSANDALTGLTDPINGVFQSAINSTQASITSDNQDISNQQDRINTMQTNLDAQMAAADTAISGLEQQYSYLSEMFQQMQANEESGML